MGWKVVPIFLFYMSYLQETTSTCHRHPKLTEFLMQIGFPHAHTREKSCQQLGRHHQRQYGSTRAICDGDPASQLSHLAVHRTRPVRVAAWGANALVPWHCWSYKHTALHQSCTIAFQSKGWGKQRDCRAEEGVPIPSNTLGLSPCARACGHDERQRGE